MENEAGSTVSLTTAVSTQSAVSLSKNVDKCESEVSLTQMFELDPDREEEFNKEIELLNQQLGFTQHKLCEDYKEQKELRSRRYEFTKEDVLDALSIDGILYLPGNFLEPIKGRRIGDSEIPLIVEAIKEIPEDNLKGLNFAYNTITDDGIRQLAEVIKDRQSLIHLNIAHNDFTTDGLQTLVASLIDRRPLHTLKISGVKVGDQGINSITCLYLSGKGPVELDVSETDMTTPGFQALCSALKALDDNEDYPEFLKRQRLPFSLETLAKVKQENHEVMKEEAQKHLCRSQLDFTPAHEKESPLEEAITHHMNQSGERDRRLMDELAEVLENSFTNKFLAGGDCAHYVDFSQEVQDAKQFEEKSRKLPPVDDILAEFKTVQGSGCYSKRPDGRPIIVCPSLYNLEFDEFNEEDTDKAHLIHPTLKRVNPMIMDTKVDPEKMAEFSQPGKEGLDQMTAHRAAAKFMNKSFKKAGGIAGASEFPHDSDLAQQLLMAILRNARSLLRGETQDEPDEAELKAIWQRSLEIAVKTFRPAIPADCDVSEARMKVFVEEFMQVSSGTFFKLIQLPFFSYLFEHTATKSCPESRMSLGDRLEFDTPINKAQYECVGNVVLKFLEEVIIRAGEIIGGGDPFDFRGKALSESSRHKEVGQPTWPSIMDMTEEMVVPLVNKLFDVGGLLARDAKEYLEEDEKSIEEGIEPAKIYLDSVFKQLTNYLLRMKDDSDPNSRQAKKAAAFVSKPVRLVLNRPFFNGYEHIMATKLANYLRHNLSIQCLHLRKWNLCEDGTLNLMDGILANTNIVTLDLSCNGIGAEGMHSIEEYLRRNQKLKHLILNHNRLRNPGVQILAKSIPESSLVSLNVAYNGLTEMGLNPFLEAIGKSQISSLYILGNCFSQSTCQILHELFASGSLVQAECDVQTQEIDGELMIGKNSQARDLNSWYDVPIPKDMEFTCPPFYKEVYSAYKISNCDDNEIDFDLPNFQLD